MLESYVVVFVPMIAIYGEGNGADGYEQKEACPQKR